MRNLFVFFLVLTSFATANAQTGDDLSGDKVDVVKTFEAQLEETNRIGLVPQLPPIDTSTKEQIFVIPTRKFDFEYPAPRIKPLAMKREKVADVYNTFLKVGAGLPSSFYGEGAFNKFVDGRYDINGVLKHHTANFSNDEVEHQKFRETSIGLGGTYFFDQGFAVNANLGFESDKVHFYGYNYDPDFVMATPIDEDDVKQVFNTFDMSAYIINGERTQGDINYKAGFDFYALNDNYSSSENGLTLNLWGQKWFQDQHSLDLGLIADFTDYEDTLKQELDNIYIQPAFTFHAGRFSVKVGANMVLHDNDFRFYPNAEAAVNITGSELSVFAGASGDLQKNTFQSLSNYNPFIASRSPAMRINNTSYYYYYGGIKGNIKILEYRGEIGFKQADDLALFVLDDTNPFEDTPRRRFQVLYDTVNIVSIKGTINANILKNLDLLGTVAYNVYDTKTQDRPWHLPALEVNAGLTYLMLEKLKLSANLFVENGVPVPSPTSEKLNLNSLFDLSLGAEYWLGDKFGVWLQVNNILDNERQRWQYYPTYGINALVGVSAKF